MSVVINVASNGKNGYGNVNNISGINHAGSAEASSKNKADGKFFVGTGKDANPIDDKRKDALKKALKVVKNAWDNDRSIDKTLDTMRSHYDEMKNIYTETNRHMEGLQEDKDRLKEQYGVIEDSDEYRDLQQLEQLLEKRYSGRLTEEEAEQLNELNSKPHTEYQSRSLEIFNQILEDRSIAENAKKEMQDDVANIQRIRSERLKSHAMVDAQKEAEDIIENANDEIIGMLIDEAREYIDEKQEENEEKAEKVTEEQEEKNERLEDMRELRKIKEAMIEGTKEAVEEARAEQNRNDNPDINLNDMLGMIKANTYSDGVKQSLNEIKSSMRLVEADLKGLQVDAEV